MILEQIASMFLVMLVEVLPFMITGIILSSIIRVFASTELLIKIFPENGIRGIIIAMFGGLLFPICECAIVPIAARLIKKGVPLHIAIIFMLSSPIINPIVIASTYYAFPNRIEMVIYRVIFGLIIALVTGIIIKIKNFKLEEVLINIEQDHLSTCNCEHCSSTPFSNEKKVLGKMRQVFFYASEEFFEAGKYLIIGILLTSVIQNIVPKSIFYKISNLSFIQQLIMMAISFIFSICSTSDAFVAKSFIGSFSYSSIMAFLVFGPMLDLKNIFMLSSSLKKKFIVQYVTILTVVSICLLFILTLLFM